MLDNVAFGLRARGCRSSRGPATGWRSGCDRVGLAGRDACAPGRALRRAGATSGARACARAANPALLLLDEPLAALDATTRNDVRRDLRRHLATFPGVRLLITHDPIDAAVLADRVVVLDHGRVAQTGTPAEITARPRTPLGRGAHRHESLRRRQLTPTDASRSTPAATLVVADHREPGPVFAVVHPRAVSLHRAQPEGSARNSWPGASGAVEPVGDRYRVRGRRHATRRRRSDTGPRYERSASREGIEVWVAVKATEVDVYPA